MKRVILSLFVAVALMAALSETAKAGNFGFYGAFPQYGFSHGTSLYGLGRIPVPPYHALHPPVYYSQPIPRPYGHSPFAWRGGESQQINPEPSVMINPYFKPSEPKAKVEETRTARIIVNPFAVDDAEQLVGPANAR